MNGKHRITQCRLVIDRSKRKIGFSTELIRSFTNTKVIALCFGSGLLGGTISTVLSTPHFILFLIGLILINYAILSK